MKEQVIILIPVFNDEESLNILLEKLGIAFNNYSDYQFTVLVADDGSGEKPVVKAPAVFGLKILHLHRTIGHQKAIAVGLAYISENMECDKVLVMDGDGEDSPEDAVRLLNISKTEPGKIVFGYRKSRQEGQSFRFFYTVYKIMFNILTGKKINFGNFLVMPKSILKKAVYYSEIWNHIPGGLIKTGLPYLSAPTNRAARYAGKSKMNFHALLMHGLGAIAVFIDVIATRLLLFSLLMIGFSLATILVLIGIKSFTDNAIPGWTSTVISAMLIILLQSFLLSLFTIFLYLSSQSQRKFIPAHHYKDYTGVVEPIQ